MANRPDMGDYFMQSNEKGIQFKVSAGHDNLGKDELFRPTSDREVIRIVPVPAGRSAGAQTVIGAVLFVVGALTYNYGGGFLMSIGASLMLGGVARMLASSPAMLEPNEAHENRPSFVF